MNKKPYLAPTVKKVELVVKNAVLASCHSSTVTQAYDTSLPTTQPCSVTGCLNPPLLG